VPAANGGVPDFLAARLHNIFGQNLDMASLVSRSRAAVLDTAQVSDQDFAAPDILQGFLARIRTWRRWCRAPVLYTARVSKRPFSWLHGASFLHQRFSDPHLFGQNPRHSDAGVALACQRHGHAQVSEQNFCHF